MKNKILDACSKYGVVIGVALGTAAISLISGIATQKQDEERENRENRLIELLESKNEEEA